MHTHANSPAAGWRWFLRAVNLGRNNPRAIFGAVALLALVALLPSLVQAVLQVGLGLGPNATVSVIGLLALAMIVVYPLLIGGVLRVIDDAEHGRPTHATALFDTFRAGRGAGRLVGFGVAMSVLYLAAFAVVVRLFGKDVADWYLELLSASSQPDQAAAQAAMAQALQDMPPGFGTVMAVGTLVGLFFGGIYAIGFGQVALAGRSVFGALADGVAGTVKNVLPLVLLAVVAFFACAALMLAMIVVGGLLAMFGGLVHPVLAAVLVLPVYLGMLLVMYVVLFGAMYALWRDVCGDPGDAPGALPPDRVVL